MGVRNLTGYLSVAVAIVLVTVLNVPVGGRAGRMFSPLLYQFFLVPVILATFFFGLRAGVQMAFIATLYGLLMLARQSLISGAVPEFSQMGVCVLAMGYFYLTAAVLDGFRQATGRMEELVAADAEMLRGEVRELDSSSRRAKLQNDDLDYQGRHLGELYEVTREMSVALDEDRIVATMHDALTSTFRFSRGELILLEEPGHLDRVRVRHGLCENSRLEASVPVDRRASLGRIFREGRPVLITGQNEARRWGLPAGLYSLAAAPLRAEDRMIGIILLEDVEMRREGYVIFDREVLAILEILSGQFALQVEKARLYRRVQELSITDGLTGLSLRRHFMERMEDELKRSSRHGFHAVFLILDIDHFKKYNDEYGHLVGDAVLKDVAMIIADSIREVDLACRYGGEEFVVMLPETSGEEGVQVAERIRQSVEGHSFKAYDEETRVTISTGVGSFPEDGERGMDVVDRADEALLTAKRTGRNRVSVYECDRGQRAGTAEGGA